MLYKRPNGITWATCAILHEFIYISVSTCLVYVDSNKVAVFKIGLFELLVSK